MRLEASHDAAAPRISGAGERCFDLGRVVAVVVVNDDPGFLALELEPAAYALELRKSVCRLLEGEADFKASRDRGKGGERIVPSGNIALGIAELLVVLPDLEA